MKWRWWVSNKQKPKEILTLDKLMANALAYSEQKHTALVTIHPKPLAVLEEVCLRLDKTQMEVLAIGIEVLFAITEGGNRHFGVKRFGKQLWFKIKEKVDG